MLSDQSKGFQKLIFERIFRIRDDILIRDPEYISLRSSKHFATRWIKEKLSSKSAILRLRYMAL